MLSFRKKILLSDVILFLIFISLLFPFVERTVGNIVRHSLEDRARELIGKLSKEPSLDSMIEYLSNEKAFIFFRVTLFDHNGEILYDTHIADLHQSESEEEINNRNRPEVIEALKYGRGYSDRYSNVFRQPIAYAALSFEAHDTEYVMRIGLPFTEIRELTHDFEFGFLTLGAVILLLYSLMTWAIMHRLSVPIQHIITAIRPYQEGREEFLPRIEIGKEIQEGDDFGRLAQTLNTLNARIQKQIENLMKQRNETKAILESLGEGVIAVDTQGTIIFANRVFGKMLHIDHEILVNQKLNKIRPKREDLAQKCYELVSLAQQRLETIVQTFIVKDGQKLYFDVIATPLLPSGTILVLQDKTSDYKVLEMGKDFIANASHELRTPITIIRGFAETLNDLPNLSQQLLGEITEKIVKTCHRLDSLVKSILTLADIENISPDRFHLANLVTISENCLDFLRAANPTVQSSLDAKIENAPIRADADLIEMAIMNLLQNAVKYSPSPAHIEMVIEQQGDFVLLHVKDKGIGIPEADLPHIFDRFYTVDKARSRKFGGTGLGLSIVKTVIHKHNGRIAVTSQLGVGTTFTVSLPLEKN